MTRFDRRYAKRVMADAALREAVRLSDEVKQVGGFDEYHTSRWAKMRALAMQAAEQLRQSEEG